MTKRTEKQIDEDIKFVNELKSELILKAAAAQSDHRKVQRVVNPDVKIKPGFIFSDWLSEDDNETFKSLNNGEGKLLYEKKYAGKTDEQIEEGRFWKKEIYNRFLSQAIGLNNESEIARFQKKLDDLENDDPTSPETDPALPDNQA